MPGVTELAFFQFIPPNRWNSTAEFRDLFARASASQTQWSTHPLMFFQDIKDPSKLYLLSGWESVDAHTKWVESAENQKLFESVVKYLKFDGISHLEMDFEEIPPHLERICIEKVEEGQQVETGSGWSRIANAVDEKGVTYSLRSSTTKDEGAQRVYVDAK